MGEIETIGSALGGVLAPPSPINKSHDLSLFTCGKSALDDWLKQRALKVEGKTARTYVVCQGLTVIAFYSLAMGGVHRADLPRKLRQNTPDSVPVAIMARMGVDVRFQKLGVGKGLIKDGLLRVVEASKIVGTRAVLVHAIDEDVNSFYKRYGFIEFPGGSQTFYLPLETIVDAL